MRQTNEFCQGFSSIERRDHEDEIAQFIPSNMGHQLS